MLGEKDPKMKRMSLDPSKNMPIFSKSQKHHATEINVKQNIKEESQSSISNHDQYSNEDVIHLLFSSKKYFMLFLREKNRLLSNIFIQYSIKKAMGTASTLLSIW